MICLCDNGRAKVSFHFFSGNELNNLSKILFKPCRPILCTPPPDCKNYRKGESCCEYICLDEKPPKEGEGANMKAITVIVVTMSLLLIFLCCLYLHRRYKKEIDAYIEMQRLKRAQRRVRRELQVVCARRAFNDDAQKKLSMELIAKNDEIDALKKRIAVLESQPNNRESEDSNDEQDWRNSYDLEVEVNGVHK